MPEKTFETGVAIAYLNLLAESVRDRDLEALWSLLDNLRLSYEQGEFSDYTYRILLTQTRNALRTVRLALAFSYL